MPFKKGDKRPAGAGRKPNTPNKTTREMRNILAPVVEGYINGGEGAEFSLAEDLKDMDPAERARIMKDLVPYVLPKLASVEVKADIEHKGFKEELDALSEEG